MKNHKTLFAARGRRAFSFLEIMLVVVIIGILAGLVAPRLVGQSQKAKLSATRNQIGAIKTALGMFEAQSGQFPTTSEGLDALVHRPSSFPEQEWKGSFMSEVPKDTWHRDFIYVSPGQHDPDFDLSSMGPDGQAGTEDDLNSWAAEEAGGK